jgi:16S rRNA (guanine527-N7)-methyltransferase
MTGAAARLASGAATALGRPLADGETADMIKYLNLLIKWHRSQRLVGSAEPAWIVDNVLLDSLLFARALPATALTLCDVGSGAGVPGIPLKIVLPALNVTLIEARQRRASFLSAVVRELALSRCRIINTRLEQVADELAGSFDAVVMRCAGSPADLLPLVTRLLRPGGLVIASGPPQASPLLGGEWFEVQGPRGPRRFWRYRREEAPSQSAS